MRFTCPTCNQLIQAADDAGGQVVACPTCRQRVRVPGEASAPARPAPIDKTLLGQIQENPAAYHPPPAARQEPPAAPRDYDERRDDWDDDRRPRRRRRYYHDEPEYVRREPEVNIGLAVASLVCGIVGAVFFWCVFVGPICGILGVIFGGIHFSNKVKEGNGLAIGGLVTGGAGIVLFVGFLIIALATRSTMLWFR